MEKSKEAEKLIFLDFDGVLNDPFWIIDNWQKKADRGEHLLEFDPERVGRLMSICEKTKAKLVLISTWNYREGVDTFFKINGFEVAGRLGSYYIPRGEMIKYWFIEHPEYKDANYAILDDEKSEYDEEQLKHLVWTGHEMALEGWTKQNIHMAGWLIGLDKSHEEQIFNLLEVKDE